MASSSNTSHIHLHMEEEVAADEKANWLQLGLGLELGFTSRSRNQAGDRELESNPVRSASGHDHHHHQQQHQHVISSSTFHFVTNDHEHQREQRRLGLGLGLGLEIGVSGNVENDEVVVKQKMGTSHVAINISSSDDVDDEFNNHTPHEHNYCYGHGLQSWQMPCIQYHMMSGPHHHHHHHHPSPPPNQRDYCYPTTRSHPGLWFTLLSSTNRNGELALPQIPRAYIRVKDENATVFMVKKYLIRKLGLSNEAEVDISCMGQKLMHMETLKHVRDCIWLPRIIESVNSRTILFEQFDGNSVGYLMCLNYARPCV